MPRPNPRTITFTIDGREVQAAENMMLVDAAKLGDVEIPVFCYEPKLGAPVGACRMCLVEVEGIPKLQTGCSTPVKDGMVVHTQTARVAQAQEAVLEFLLINHPLDCPVCDKGGECPLQDISYGWGGGLSRFVEPKRHFQKPLELSPLIAIDRERCILCYRCVRFSQEISEDYQLILNDRGAGTFVGTFDGHPYVAPFSGNIIELCPVGALTSRPYRFRARPWDIEGSGSVCGLCPAQCNVTFTVRDDRVLRVLARQNDAVDDGWLCDRGRFAYQSMSVDERITTPLMRDGGELREVPWDAALDAAAKALGKAGGGRAAALAGAATTNEEGFLLQRLLREALSSGHIDATGVSSEDLWALARPDLQVSVADVDFANTILVLGTEPVDDMPILDLRIRKGVRRNRVNLAVATSRLSSLDANAALSVRYAPGGEGAFVDALATALYGGDCGDAAAAAGSDEAAVRKLADLLRTGGDDGPGDVAIVYGQRLLAAGDGVAPALLKIAAGLNMPGKATAGLLAVPSATNDRGLAEAGVLPGFGPGFNATDGPARGVEDIRDGLAAGDLTALYLLHDDPLLTRDGHAEWESALDKATTVVAHAQFLTPAVAKHATVVFPAESYAEKEGTITHPDGRVQRLRAAVGHRGKTRADWWVLSEIAKRLGHDFNALTSSMVSKQLFTAVPFYAGLTLEEIGGTGVRWHERDAAAAFVAAPDRAAEPYNTAASPNGALRLGTFRSIWAAPEVELSPALAFLHPRQQVEMAPADAEALGLTHGARAVITSGEAKVRATVVLRANTPPGSVFMQTGITDGSAGSLHGPLVKVSKA